MTLAQVVDGVTDLDSALFNPIIDRINNAGSGIANVFDYGAAGDGSTDDTAAIQDAIDSEAATVVFSPPDDSAGYAYYKVSSALTPKANQRWVGAGLQYVHTGYASSVPRVRIGGSSSYNGPIISANGINGVTLDGLTITGSGNAAHGSNVGVQVTSGSWWSIRNCMFNNFGGSALVWASGAAMELYRNFTTNCVLKRTGHTDYIGVFDLSGTDPYVAFNELTASNSSVDTGYIAALSVKSANGFYVGNVCEISEVGIHVDDNGSAIANGFYGNRADLNLTHGYVVQGGNNLFVGNRSYRNGRAAHNTYDGFSISSVNSQYIGNTVSNIASSDSSLAMRDGFHDTSSPGSGQKNFYLGNACQDISGSLYNAMHARHHVVDFFTTKPTYTASNVTPARSYDADSTTTGELADVLGTLIADLQAQGVLG